MEERILRNKLEEYQLFILGNRYGKDEKVLKDFFKGMVEDKPTRKAIEILEYIKYHKRDDIKTMLKGERFGIWQYGENFFMWTDRVIDDLVDSLQDEAERVGGSPVVQSDSDAPELGGGSCMDSKEEKKQPQKKEVPPFETCILVSNKQEYLEKLHELIDNKVGKAVAMVIQAAMSTSGIIKPSSTQVKEEFKHIGNISGYNAYLKADFSQDLDYKHIKEILLELKK